MKNSTRVLTAILTPVLFFTGFQMGRRNPDDSEAAVTNTRVVNIDMEDYYASLNPQGTMQAVTNSSNTSNTSNSSNTSNTSNTLKKEGTKAINKSNTSGSIPMNFSNTPLSVPVNNEFQAGVLKEADEIASKMGFTKKDMLRENYSYTITDKKKNKINLTYRIVSRGDERNILMFIFPDKADLLTTKEGKELLENSVKPVSDIYGISPASVVSLSLKALDVLKEDISAEEMTENGKALVTVESSLFKEIPVLEVRFTEKEKSGLNTEDLKSELNKVLGEMTSQDSEVGYYDKDSHDLTFLKEIYEDRSEDYIGLTWKFNLKDRENPMDDLTGMLKKLPKEYGLNVDKLMDEVRSVYDYTYEFKEDENQELPYVRLKNGNSIVDVFYPDDIGNQFVKVKAVRSEKDGSYIKPY